MQNTYNSTDFWYTFVNSLYNEGLSCGRGELEMDEEMQEKFLVYLKEKIEEGITDGETALPPGLHTYFWRFPLEVLPKTRELTDNYLKTDPINVVAALLRAIVEFSDWDANNDPDLDDIMGLIPNDPCMNLVLIDEYRAEFKLFINDIEREVKVLGALENFYAWAKRQDDSARYQEARSFDWQYSVTLYAVYRQLKDQLRQLQIQLEDSEIPEESNPDVERYKELIKKCRDLVPMENAAFRKIVGQQSENQQDLVDAKSDHTEIWEAYLKSVENRKNAPPRRLTQNDQEQLLAFLKTKIEAGVIDGKTTLPADLQDYISDFPHAMHLELREFAEEVLESEPDNGAASKILAIIVWESKDVRHGESDRDLILLEQAMNLAPNDTETCYFALRKYEEYYDPLFNLTLTALERLFARSMQQNDSDLYQWLAKLYNEVGRTPCHIYRKLRRNPEGNTELIARSRSLIDQAINTFQQRLEEEPDDWYSLRGLGDIYQTLGETELASKYPWEPHSEYRWEQSAWEGLQLPDFSATTLDGTPISFSDYRGNLVLLNFCAWWCGPCKPEIPYIKEVYEEHHKNGFEVIGISLDDSEDELRNYIEEHEIPWVQIFDSKGWHSEIARFFGINFIPSQWLIDRDGTIISVMNRQFLLGQNVNRTEATRIGDIVADFSTTDIDGNPVSSETFRGKVTLFYLGFPNQVLKDLEAIYRKYHQKGFEVIGVSVMGYQDEDQLRDNVREDKVIGRHIYDGGHWNGPLAKQFGVGAGRTYPAIVLINKEGKVIMARNREVHSPEEWVAKLDEYIATHLGLS